MRHNFSHTPFTFSSDILHLNPFNTWQRPDIFYHVLLYKTFDFKVLFWSFLYLFCTIYLIVTVKMLSDQGQMDAFMMLVAVLRQRGLCKSSRAGKEHPVIFLGCVANPLELIFCCTVQQYKTYMATLRLPTVSLKP